MKLILKTACLAAALIISACATTPVETTKDEAPDSLISTDNLPLEPTAPEPESVPVPAKMPVPTQPAITEPTKTELAAEMPVVAEVPVIAEAPAIAAPSMPAPASIPVPSKPKPVLKVKVSGLKTAKGVLMAALYDKAGYSAKTGTPVATKNIPVTGEGVAFTFKGMPEGEYGLKLFHDVDENGELNTNFIGIPTEPYAFSNSALNPFGEAKWKDARFTVGDDGAVQVIGFK